MELEEMKTAWLDMSTELNKQKKLTDKLIMEMTQEKFNRKLNKVYIPEVIGGVVCILMLAYVLFNFALLDTWYLMAAGAITVAILLVLPVMSLSALNRMRHVNILENNYKQTLIDYTAAKRQFMKAQKLGYYFGFVMMIISLPVLAKLFNNKDLFLEINVWLWYVPIGGLFLYFFARWVYKHYKNSVTAAGALLADLEED